MLRFLLAWSSATASLVVLVWGVGGAASAQSSEDTGMIRAIEPSLDGSNVTTSILSVETARRLALSIIVIGPDGIQDQSLASTVDLVWSASGGELKVHDDTTRATYVVPRAKGTYTVTASAGLECIGEATDCNATFTIRALGGPPPPPYHLLAQNPPGEIPAAIVDAKGNQYVVFTPEEGGTFIGGDFKVMADRGDVPNGEYIGVRMFENGPASNAGVSHNIYTLSGNQYTISIVDAEGIPIVSYALNRPVEVCIPVPDELRTNYLTLEMVTKNKDGTLTPTLYPNFAWTPTTSSPLIICGNTSTLPATLAVGIPGTPPPLLEPEPEPAEMLPVTGAAAPASTIAVIWILLFGIALIGAGVFMTAHRRRRYKGTR